MKVILIIKIDGMSSQKTTSTSHTDWEEKVYTKPFWGLVIIPELWI